MPTASVTGPPDAAAGYERLRERVLDLHPYEVPCVERFEEADELVAFADWREGASAPTEAG